ncbi:pirin family protein [Nonomuraea antimicrobica]
MPSPGSPPPTWTPSSTWTRWARSSTRQASPRAPWHPHRGFETVTYIIDGVFDHEDSNGGGGTITDGDTQWMTAGSGLLHIEKPRSTWWSRAGCSTACNCGSTCPGRTSSTRRATRTSAVARRRCSPPPTAARCSG